MAASDPLRTLARETMLRRMRKLGNVYAARCRLLLLASLAGACATVPPPTVTAEIFQRPAAFEGRNVRACGYIGSDGFNMYDVDQSSSNGPPYGLALVRRYPVPASLHGWRCVSGPVVRIGCTEDVICIRYTFPYGIRAPRIH